MVIGGPGYVQGPIRLTHICRHVSEMHCIETTVEHVRLMESGPCLGCYHAGLRRTDFDPDARPALSLEEEEVEEESEPGEAGQLSIF